MKRCLIIVLMAALVLPQALHAQSGAQQIIKQRAKDLRDQNNARQGVTPPAPAQNSSAPQQPAQAAPAQPLTPQQQMMAKLQADLSAMRPGTPVTPEMKQQLTRDLIAISQASPKPSSQAATRLSDDLAAALSQKLLATVTRNRLAQNLSAVLNPTTTKASQVPDIVADIQAIFESNGVPAADAKRAAEAAKAAAAELRKPEAK